MLGRYNLAFLFLLKAKGLPDGLSPTFALTIL